MADEWETRIDAFWKAADDADEEATLHAMKSLVDERPNGDAIATYEWASVHDFLGREGEAIPLYREALVQGLAGSRHSQALVQLASSLRNVGELGEAIQILEQMNEDEAVGDAPQAFLALALFDAGKSGEALRVSLNALAKTVPAYGGAITNYANELPLNAKPQ